MTVGEAAIPVEMRNAATHVSPSYAYNICCDKFTSIQWTPPPPPGLTTGSGVSVGNGISVSVGQGVSVGVKVAVGEGVSVAVGVRVNVEVGVKVKVGVNVAVDVKVEVGLGVYVGLSIAAKTPGRPDVEFPIRKKANTEAAFTGQNTQAPVTQMMIRKIVRNDQRYLAECLTKSCPSKEGAAAAVGAGNFCTLG